MISNLLIEKIRDISIANFAIKQAADDFSRNLTSQLTDQSFHIDISYNSNFLRSFLRRYMKSDVRSKNAIICFFVKRINENINQPSSTKRIEKSAFHDFISEKEWIFELSYDLNFEERYLRLFISL